VSSDELITSLISAARVTIEAELHRTLINTDYVQYYDAFPTQIELYRPPVSVITSIKYKDSNSVQQTLAETDYQSDINSLPPRIIPALNASWPSTDGSLSNVQVTFTAGYGLTGASVPMPIRQAILLMVADMFEHAESQTEINLQPNKTVNNLLAAFRIPELGDNEND
jgi:uncharacterized phiE125 gp8 family phage protein